MNIISADEVDRLLDFPSLIDALQAAFRKGVNAPPRHHHTKENRGRPDQTLLLMPAWDERFVAVKIACVTPDNGVRSLPAVMASVHLMDGTTGEQIAMIDGARLTVWRTAAASALAARYLSPAEPETLLVVGTGALAPYLVRAHCSVRSYRKVLVWGRDTTKTEAVADGLVDEGFPTEAIADLDEAVPSAQVISTATLSREPLIKGAFLQPGTHLDLVGAFTPLMRETDDECVRRAELYVDTRPGALKEGGDLVQPIKAGVISETDVKASLEDLARGTASGRSDHSAITLFKSTGASLEDLVAARLITERFGL